LVIDLKESAMPAALDSKRVTELLKQTPGWSLSNGQIERTFSFKNYYETMGFVNAVAYIANQADHHPDMEVHYNNCKVAYSTHSVGGLSEADFTSAGKVNQLIDK
jgi:4a-hydroxytetrahydrobiopterin dehydratase